MADITTLLSLQARSRRNALRAARTLHAVREQRAEAERVVREAQEAAQSGRRLRAVAGAER